MKICFFGLNSQISIILIQTHFQKIRGIFINLKIWSKLRKIYQKILLIVPCLNNFGTVWSPNIWILAFHCSLNFYINVLTNMNNFSELVRFSTKTIENCTSCTNVVFSNSVALFFLCLFKFYVTKTIIVKKIWTLQIPYRIPTRKKMTMWKAKKSQIWVLNLLFASQIIQLMARKNFVTKLILVALIALPVPKHRIP